MTLTLEIHWAICQSRAMFGSSVSKEPLMLLQFLDDLNRADSGINKCDCCQ